MDTDQPTITPVKPAALRPGLRLPRDLYTTQGVKLLSRGTILSPQVCQTLAAAGWADLCFAPLDPADHPDPDFDSESPDDSSPLETREIAADEAQQSSPPTHAGRVIEPRLVPLPEALSPDTLTRDERRRRAWVVRNAEGTVAARAPVWEHLPRSIAPSVLPAPPRRRRVAWPDDCDLCRFRVERQERWSQIMSRLIHAQRVDIAQLLMIVDELIELRAAHADRFTRLALPDTPADDFLPDHCFATGCLAIAAAGRLGWADDHLRLAALAGLLADIGMALLPEYLRSSAHPLTEIELNRVRRAPAFSVALAQNIDALPDDVHLAIHQHHEREDGSGYPRGIRSDRLTDLARVVAVSDTFAAAASPRRYRPRKRPYDAAIDLVHQAARGSLSSTIVRALIESTGLYPVGSYIALSNGKPAVVVRTHPLRPDRPVVRIFDRHPDGQPSDLIVDLADLSANILHVARAIDPPPAIFASAHECLYQSISQS